MYKVTSISAKLHSFQFQDYSSPLTAAAPAHGRFLAPAGYLDGIVVASLSVLVNAQLIGARFILFTLNDIFPEYLGDVLGFLDCLAVSWACWCEASLVPEALTDLLPCSCEYSVVTVEGNPRGAPEVSIRR